MRNACVGYQYVYAAERRAYIFGHAFRSGSVGNITLDGNGHCANFGHLLHKALHCIIVFMITRSYLVACAGEMQRRAFAYPARSAAYPYGFCHCMSSAKSIKMLR